MVAWSAPDEHDSWPIAAASINGVATTPQPFFVACCMYSELRLVCLGRGTKGKMQMKQMEAFAQVMSSLQFIVHT